MLQLENLPGKQSEIVLWFLWSFYAQVDSKLWTRLTWRSCSLHHDFFLPFASPDVRSTSAISLRSSLRLNQARTLHQFPGIGVFPHSLPIPGTSYLLLLWLVPLYWCSLALAPGLTCPHATLQWLREQHLFSTRHTHGPWLNVGVIASITLQGFHPHLFLFFTLPNVFHYIFV